MPSAAQKRWYAPVKRCGDFVIGLFCLVAALPAMVLIAAAVFCTMGPPVFFRQQRPGLKGRPFYLIKFRTMRPPRPGEANARFDGPRLTPLGRLLRSTSLDELPTLWNVVTGAMSLVGPRPLLMQYLQRYTPEQARRHDVKPGITGWAQINGRNAISWEQKFIHDVWYVDHCSAWLDMKILLMTVARVVKREGISFGSDATMPEFMGSGVGQANTNITHSGKGQGQ